jgi:XTP/dITP diphosphohydrolase
LSGVRVLVATRSRHKLAEIRELAGVAELELVSLLDIGYPATPEEDEIESHDTFEANAAAKAAYFRERTGLPTIADDSGLCVDALGGEPGVRTKRFAPPELAAEMGRDAANNRHLLDRLEGVPAEERGAHYVCALAVAADDERFVVRGEVHGRIAEEERGRGGFGYDPLFIVPEDGRTFGESPPEVKAGMSHRARAVEALRPWLERMVGAAE